MNKYGKGILISVYILTFLASLYYFILSSFPSKEMGSYLGKMINENFPKFRASFGRVELGPDLSLRIKPFILKDQPLEKEYIRAKEVRARIQPLSILVLRPLVVLNGTIGSGYIFLRSEIPLRGSSSVDSFHATFKEIDLSSSALNELFLDYKIKGILSGDVQIKGLSRSLPGLEGKVDLKIREFSLNFTKFNLGIREVDLEQLEVTGTITNGNFKAETVKGKGKDLNLEVLGQISLKEPVANSDVNLNLNIISGPKFLDKFPKESPFRAIVEKRLKSSNRISIKITGTLKGLNWQIK